MNRELNQQMKRLSLKKLIKFVCYLLLAVSVYTLLGAAMYIVFVNYTEQIEQTDQKKLDDLINQLPVLPLLPPQQLPQVPKVPPKNPLPDKFYFVRI